jgi:hypothetical protein
VDEALCLKVGNKNPGYAERYANDRRDLGHRARSVTHAQNALTLRFWVDPVGSSGRCGRDERLESDVLDGTCAASRSQVGANPPAIRCLHRVTFPSRILVSRPGLRG